MATTYINNWVYDTKAVPESSIRAMERAKKQDAQRIKNGWRWITITPRTKILVPCDENGNPTEEGKRKIDAIKNGII